MSRLVVTVVAVVLCMLAPELFVSTAAAQSRDTASGDEARSAQQRRRPRRRRPRRRPPREATPPPEAEPETTAEPEGEADVAEADPDASVRGRVEGESSVREATAGAGDAEDEEVSPTGSSLRRSNRMEFDPRLIRGESAGSGAVILFDRGRRALPPLAQRRRRFLRPTIEAAVGPERAARDSASRP
jgi:hypothetical protein